MSPDSASISIEQANEILKAHRLRKTFARISILRAITSFPTPVTHGEMSEQLLGQGFDNSTIFRALNDLSEAGILIRLDVGDHIWRFEMGPALSEHLAPNRRHPHAVCRECGRIECLEWQKGSNLLASNLQGWQIDEAIFRGFCNQCNPSEESLPDSH